MFERSSDWSTRKWNELVAIYQREILEESEKSEAGAQPLAMALDWGRNNRSLYDVHVLLASGANCSDMAGVPGRRTRPQREREAAQWQKQRH